MSQEERRDKKLNELQSLHRRLTAERIPLQEEFKKQAKILEKARKKLNDKNKEIKNIGEKIFHLKHDGETPHITDHAIVRYLERVEKVDIWELKSKVANSKNIVVENNVIVTVNEDLSDEKI